MPAVSGPSGMGSVAQSAGHPSTKAPCSSPSSSSQRWATASVWLDGGGVEGGVDREKVLEGLRRQTIRDQRRPLRFHEEQLAGGWLRQQCGQWAKCSGC